MAVWDLPDPAALIGTYAQKMAAFRATYAAIEARIKLLVAAAAFSYFDQLNDLAERIGRIGEARNDTLSA